MSVDKTDFGLVLCNHANFNRFEETSSYWSIKQISVFLCFSLVNQRHTSCTTVYNRTVTNIENTAAIAVVVFFFLFLFFLLILFLFSLSISSRESSRWLLTTLYVFFSSIINLGNF